MPKHPLTTAREQRNISQSKLGAAVGINPAEISRIENWKRYPCPSWRSKIADYLNKPEHELFPKPDDLIDMIAYLKEENRQLTERLAALQHVNTQQAAIARDNTRFL